MLHNPFLVPRSRPPIPPLLPSSPALIRSFIPLRLSWRFPFFAPLHSVREASLNSISYGHLPSNPPGSAEPPELSRASPYPHRLSTKTPGRWSRWFILTFPYHRRPPARLTLISSSFFTGLPPRGPSVTTNLTFVDFCVTAVFLILHF